ncbi:MAG: MFS transporter [Acidobacteriaceae bacterium]|nr:MFS transporter [Acidobacteriaceae bacterium]
MPPTSPPQDTHGPSLPWLATGFFLAGLGTALLGPLLPFLAASWHMTDARSGTLFLAKFLGAFLGGVTVSRQARNSIFLGTVFCFAGFGCFAFSEGVVSGSLSLLLGGYGLGQMIASTNIYAGKRYRNHTGSALAALNFFWALGAVITGILAGWCVPAYGLRTSLLVFAALFVTVGLGGWFSTARGAPASGVEVPLDQSLSGSTVLLFAALLFLYGGLETCLTSWLPTFTLRFSDAQLLHGESAVVLFWVALTGGRLLASLLLRWFPEHLVASGGVLLSMLFTLALLFTHRASAFSALCILAGLALSPFFPGVWAVLMRRNPSSRLAGSILAVSGLGAALFPWLMGVVSTASESLRIAMLVPIALGFLLAILTLTAKPTGEAPANIVSS